MNLDGMYLIGFLLIDCRLVLILPGLITQFFFHKRKNLLILIVFTCQNNYTIDNKIVTGQ